MRSQTGAGLWRCARHSRRCGQSRGQFVGECPEALAELDALAASFEGELRGDRGAVRAGGLMAGVRMGREGRATISGMAETAPTRVTEPELAGSYVVAEQRDDGTLVLRPDGAAETGRRARDLAERHRETLDYLAEH